MKLTFVSFMLIKQSCIIVAKTGRLPIDYDYILKKNKTIDYDYD
jgi:hypothetical protein